MKMKSIPTIIPAIIYIITLVSCKNTIPKEFGNSVINTPSTKETLSTASQPVNQRYYSEASIDSSSAQSIKTFLRSYLKSELPNLNESDRKFSFYAIDLNDDKKNEYLVSLTGSYFCGTGGCTFYLLNDKFELINTFTVTNPPIFKSSEKTEGWHDLIILGKQNNNTILTYRHLKRKNGQYPSNPSLIEDVNIAPSGHDFVMWHPEYSIAKPLEF